MGRSLPASRIRAWSTLTLTVASLCAAAPVLAQPFAWALPAGGETWTAGTTHTVAWTGGNLGWNVNVQVIRLVPYQIAGSIALASGNDGFASWSIPAGLTPGQYQVYVEDVSQGTWAYSQTFDIVAPPICQTGCSFVSVAMPYFEPPGGACGQTQAEAIANAQAYAMGQLNAACTGGSAIDPASIVIDVTLLPAGSVCLSGYSGAYVAEASAVACCCSGATESRRTSWGRLKTIYR